MTYGLCESDFAIACPAVSYGISNYVDCSHGTHTIRYEFINLTDKPLYLKSQTNTITVVAPDRVRRVRRGCDDPHVEVRTIYGFYGADSICATYEINSSLRKEGYDLEDEGNEFYSDLDKVFDRNPSRNNKVQYEFPVARYITGRELEKTKRVFLRESNTLMTFDMETLKDPHPFSSVGIQQRHLISTVNKSEHGGFVIRCVDNERLADRRYVWGAKGLIEIPSVQDDMADSGVYYTVTSHGERTDAKPITKIYSFEDAEVKLGLYIHKEDALTHGDPDRIHAKELESHKAEVEKYRRENLILKELTEKSKLTRDDVLDEKKKKREIEKLTKEAKKQKKEAKIEKKRKKTQDEFDRKERERKDYYESRSYVRKDNSELIKYIPAIILGAVGVFALFRSRPTKSLC